MVTTLDGETWEVLPGASRLTVAQREAIESDDEIVVNEVNTMPGFTPISMFPTLWEAEGVSFHDVVAELVTLARARHARRRALRTHRMVP